MFFSWGTATKGLVMKLFWKTIQPRRRFRQLGGERLEDRFLLTTFVDALAMYDQTALAQAGGNQQIEAWIADDFRYLNETMARSNIDLTVVNVRNMEVNIDIPAGVTDVGGLIQRGLSMDALEGFRVESGADVVYVYSANPQLSPQRCGASTVPGKTSNLPYDDHAFIVALNMQCSFRESHVAHETAHIFGAGHQREVMTPEEEADLLQPYAHAFVATIGYQDCSSGVCVEKEYSYGTQEYSSTQGHMKDRTLPVYSQPGYTATFHLPNGQQVEESIGTAEFEDNTRMILEMAGPVSEYRSAIVSMEQTVEPGSLDIAISSVSGRHMHDGSWQIVGGVLPAGLALSAQGHIIGTYQSEPGQFSVTVAAIDELSGGSHEATVTVSRTTVPSPLTNPANPQDVNGDGLVTPLDVLVVINRLNGEYGSEYVVALLNREPNFRTFVDVNGDYLISPLDVLVVINYLNTHSFGAGEAESESDFIDALVPGNDFWDAEVDWLFEDGR